MNRNKKARSPVMAGIRPEVEGKHNSIPVLYAGSENNTRGIFR